MQGSREAIAIEGAHECGIDLRISFEMIRDAGAALDLVEDVAERCRAEPVKAFDEALATKPPGRRKLGLLRWEALGLFGDRQPGSMTIPRDRPRPPRAGFRLSGPWVTRSRRRRAYLSARRAAHGGGPRATIRDRVLKCRGVAARHERLPGLRPWRSGVLVSGGRTPRARRLHRRRELDFRQGQQTEFTP